LESERKREIKERKRIASEAVNSKGKRERDDGVVD
jgi:hypothetical protein